MTFQLSPTRRQLLASAGLAMAATALAPCTMAASAPVSQSQTNFDGSGLLDISSSLPIINDGPNVSVIFRFQAAPGSGGALVSASNPAGTARWTILLAGGSLKVLAESGGLSRPTALQYPLAADRKGHLDDGFPHWVAVRTSVTGTDLFVDGQWAHTTTAPTSPSMLSGLTALSLGGTKRNAGDVELFTGMIDNVRLESSALSGAQILAACPTPTVRSRWTPDRTYGTNIPLINRLPEAPEMVGYTQGALYAEFSSTSAATMSILSAGDTREDSTDLTLALSNGNLVVEHRVRGVDTMKFTVKGTWNDGVRHSVCLTVSAYGSIVYVDGSEVERHSSTAFLAALTGMNGLWIGGNIDIGGPQWQFDGTIGKAQVHNAPLTAQQVAGIANQSVIESRAIFDNGYAGSANYRIPSLLLTANGTLIAGADQRTASPWDSPNHIQFATRRSTDGGATWNSVQVAVPQPGSGNTGASVIDSVLIQDRSTNKIILIVDRFPGGVGQGNCAVGTGYDATGQKLLTGIDGASYRLADTGVVTKPDGTSTTFFVGPDGRVTNNGSPAGTIHLQAAADPGHVLTEHLTSYMVVSTSADDGLSWSPIRDITAQVKETWMKFIGTGPGSGIQLRNGAKVGRLIVPIYYNNNVAAAGIYSSAVIYSDDAGQNWRRSASPNDGRMLNGIALDSRTLTQSAAATHEPTVVERNDGTLAMYMRNPSGRILKSTSTNQGETWSAPTQVASVPDIFSQPNAIHALDPQSGAERVLFSNASVKYPGNDGRSGRGRGVLRMSLDGGESWARNRVFRADNYVYSSMVQFPNGDIGLLWEMEWDGIYFARLPFAWLNNARMG